MAAAWCRALRPHAWAHGHGLPSRVGAGSCGSHAAGGLSWWRAPAPFLGVAEHCARTRRRCLGMVSHPTLAWQLWFPRCRPRRPARARRPEHGLRVPVCTRRRLAAWSLTPPWHVQLWFPTLPPAAACRRMAACRRPARARVAPSELTKYYNMLDAKSQTASMLPLLHAPMFQALCLSAAHDLHALPHVVHSCRASCSLR